MNEQITIIQIYLLINIIKKQSFRSKIIILQVMTQTQQYQLKVAVAHHPSLKTEQLIEFLQNQSNQFLANSLPNSLTSDKFVTIFQPQAQTQYNQFSQYVGLLLLYSTSSLQSYKFMLNNLPKPEDLADLFMIIIQMDNSDKKTNAIGNEGEKLCQKNGYQFVRLTLYNSENLVQCLQKNLYELIENYYYPNQEQKPSKKNNYQSQYLFHYNNGENQNNEHQNDDIKKSKQANPIQNYMTPNHNKTNNNVNQSWQKSAGKIIATKQQKRSIQKLLQKASQLRESRNSEIQQQQREIDESIQNVEKVLSKISKDLNSKVRSDWYTSLDHTLYSPLEKNSSSYAKIKLTQQFIDSQDEEYDINQGISDFARLSKKRMLMKSKMSRIKSPSKPNRTALFNKFIAKHRKTQPLIKLLLVVAESVIIELDIYEQSQYEELALIAIKKLGIKQSQHNFKLMLEIIQRKVEGFVKELSRAIKITQKKKIDQRSFLRSNMKDKSGGSLDRERNLYDSYTGSNSQNYQS